MKNFPIWIFIGLALIGAKLFAVYPIVELSWWIVLLPIYLPYALVYGFLLLCVSFWFFFWVLAALCLAGVSIFFLVGELVKHVLRR